MNSSIDREMSPYPRLNTGELSSKIMVVVLRIIHGAITLFFLSCIGCIYYAGVTNTTGVWSSLAIASLVLEGLVVLLNKGNCPLGHIHHKFGDDKAFFELFLPPAVAKKAVPFFGFVTVIGVVLMAVGT